MCKFTYRVLRIFVCDDTATSLDAWVLKEERHFGPIRNKSTSFSKVEGSRKKPRVLTVHARDRAWKEQQ